MKTTTKTILLLVLSVVLSTGLSNATRAQSATQRHATAGGVAGAIIGGIIGHQNDEAVEGILIGSTIGAITGGVHGRAQDNRNFGRPIGYQQYSWNQGSRSTYPATPVYGGRPYCPPRGYQSAAYGTTPYQNSRYQNSSYQNGVYQRPTPGPYASAPPSTPTTVNVVTSANAGVSISDVIQMSQSGIGDSVILNHLQANGVVSNPSTTEIIAMHKSGVSEAVINATQRTTLAAQTGTTSTSTSQPVRTATRNVYVPQSSPQASPSNVYHIYNNSSARRPF